MPKANDTAQAYYVRSTEEDPQSSADFVSLVNRSLKVIDVIGGRPNEQQLLYDTPALALEGINDFRDDNGREAIGDKAVFYEVTVRRISATE